MTKRSLVMATASVVGALALTAGSSVMAAGPTNQSSASTVSASVQSVQASAMPDANLVGTASAFLIVGVGTAAIAHRRRWASIDK